MLIYKWSKYNCYRITQKSHGMVGNAHPTIRLKYIERWYLE